MADIAIFRVNYKSDFIITLESDAGWATPFCIKFWTDSPQRAFYVQYDGETYTHCAPVAGEPTKLSVQMDDHHLGVGDLKFQIAYHFTVADFPHDTEDEVINQAAVIINEDGQQEQVMLDLNGETAPEIAFSLPAYANEQQRIANEQQRIANEEVRIANETERVIEFAEIKTEAVDATNAANAAASLANEKAQLADDKAQLADSAASLATAKAQLAQEKATYAQTQGDYAKAQGDYAKAQGDTAQADHVRAEADHTTASADHTTASNDHTQAATDHTTATSDHTQADNDHSRAESDHTRAENDHAAVEVYVDSLGAFDISAYHATGGVLAKYADLTAALGTNGANIPDALRKGGMSVKFVQSSDNKYIQARCMAQNFTTDVTQWQGVDDEPSYGSNNLVKSGGVDKAISNLRFFVGNESVQVTSNVSAVSRTYTVALGNTIPSGTTFTIKVVADGVLSDSNTFPLYYNVAESARMITSEAKNNSIITFTAPEDITSILFYTTSSSFVAAGSVSFELKDVNSLSDTVKGAVSNISRINTSLSLLNQNDYCCSFTGIGKDYTSVTVKIPQNTKKFLVVEPLVTTWELEQDTLGSGNLFKIEKSTDGVTFTEVYHCLVQNISILTKREVFSFDNCAYLRVGGRAASGVNVYFKIGSPSKDELIENNLIEWNDISPAGYNYASDLTEAKVGLAEDLQYDSVDNGKILVGYDLTTSSSFNTYTYTLTPGSYNIVSRVGWTAGASYCALYTPDGKHYRLYKEANGYFNRNIFVDHTCKLKIVGQVNNTLPKVSRIIDNSTLGFIGEGNIYVSNDYFNLIPGHRYRINLLNKDYARTESTQKNTIVFTIRCYKSDTTYNAVTTNYVGDDGGQAVVLKSNYVFTCPENHSYLQIGGRANFGVIVNCILEDITEVESDTEHGDIGANYPEQTKQIYNGLVEPVSESYISEDGKDRLSFIHISDDHGSGFGRAQELLNISPEQCQFLIDTGDMVVDKLADAYDATKPFHTITQMNACTKRVYLVLGNHDYVVGNTYTKQDVFDTFITPMNTHNSSIDVSYIATQKSYYSYDYSNSKIKTIMLDMNDGWGAEELSEQTPAGLTYRCKMSGEQINWFIGQLNDAITNSLGVCIFIHRTPATVDKNAYIPKFYDKYISGDYAFNNMSIHFLCDIVQGFIEGTSGNVTHNGSTYQYSFASPGTFIAWFGGHTHYDEVGYLENYPKQFSIQVPRPILDFGTADGTAYSTRKLSIHWNYVTISMARRKLSVLRVGDNDSKYGGKKEGFEVFF